jgi:hypothetical protein
VREREREGERDRLEKWNDSAQNLHLTLKMENR